MAATAPVKKITLDGWLKLILLEKPVPLKKMNDQSLLFFLNKIPHYFKKRTTGSELNELNLNV